MALVVVLGPEKADSSAGEVGGTAGRGGCHGQSEGTAGEEDAAGQSEGAAGEVGAAGQSEASRCSSDRASSDFSESHEVLGCWLAP
eukprot:3028930-Alexandrium_andersonii.AAC.1